MPIASDLLRQGRHEELWQMCCGFLDLDIDQFMEIQERLLIEQLQLINHSKLGQKLLRGKKPTNLEEFRRLVPITIYKDYCPELSEQKVDNLVGQPELWAHTSGRSGDYSRKWVPLTKEYIEQLSVVLYGIGMISCAQKKGDTSRIPYDAKLLYCVAPRPYISGTFADVLRMQTPLEYLPSLEEAEKMSFEDRIGKGFQQALSKGLDYFFGMSLVLVKAGEKMAANSQKVDIKPYLKQPKALWRLSKGIIKSKLARRPLMPKDIWDIKGIIGSGIDSWVYKDKIKELWGRSPLDLYSCTEGGIIATQTWDYGGMTFIPNMNFLEFIPEEEQLKLEMDRTYIPKTLLLNEVNAGETYEIVITSFHGGSLVRYRIGDMIKITSLSNKACGIKLPQMAFEQRADNIIDLVFVRLTEKAIWQAIEKAGVPYNDWVAYRTTGTELQIYIEPQDGKSIDISELTKVLYEELTKTDNDANAPDPEELANMLAFKLKVDLLPPGSFSRYSAFKQEHGADIAHIKPPHINPNDDTLSLLLAETEETIVVKAKKDKENKSNEVEKIKVSD